MAKLIASSLIASGQVPLKVAQREADPAKFLPYARHLNEDMVALDSGDIMLTFELQGRAFETADVRDLNDWHTKLNGLLRNLHDERLSIWTHLVRLRVDQYPGGTFKSGFAADLDRAYFGRINRERMFINRFFVTLVIRPGATGSDKIIQLFKRRVSKEVRQGPLIDEALVELLDDKARDFEKLMARCEPRRCTIYEHRGLMFSETMEVADMVMTGRHRRVPVVRGHLGGALYRSRTIFGAETIEVRDADASAFGGIFGIREYPAQTTPRQFEALLSVDFGFVLTQSFTFLGRAAATEKFRLRMTQMENAGDRAVSQADALIDAGDDLMSNRFVLGDHHFTLAVYAIMRGAVQYPFREYAYRGCQLAFLYFAVSSLYGSQIGMFALGGLPGQFASALGGSDVGGLGGYYDKLAGTGFETANTMRKIAADYQQTQGTLPDIGYAVFAGFLVVMVIIATLLCAAIGFVISAFGLFALALLSVVGPLFVAGLLFESTRGYFFAWLGACINYLMLIVFALVLTLFLTQTGDAIIATISENDEIGMAAIKALAFYALGFFFFLQIPMLAASLGGGGPALANQFASAIAAAGGFVAGRGATATQATSRAIERGFARGIARMRTSGSVSRGTQ